MLEKIDILSDLGKFRTELNNIIVPFSEHPNMLKGLTMRSVVERGGKRREHLLWNHKAIKIKLNEVG